MVNWLKEFIENFKRKDRFEKIGLFVLVLLTLFALLGQMSSEVYAYSSNDTIYLMQKSAEQELFSSILRNRGIISGTSTSVNYPTDMRLAQSFAIKLYDSYGLAQSDRFDFEEYDFYWFFEGNSYWIVPVAKSINQNDYASYYSNLIDAFWNGDHNSGEKSLFYRNSSYINPVLFLKGGTIHRMNDLSWVTNQTSTVNSLYRRAVFSFSSRDVRKEKIDLEKIARKLVVARYYVFSVRKYSEEEIVNMSVSQWDLLFREINFYVDNNNYVDILNNRYLFRINQTLLELKDNVDNTKVLEELERQTEEQIKQTEELERQTDIQEEFKEDFFDTSTDEVDGEMEDIFGDIQGSSSGDGFFNSLEAFVNNFLGILINYQTNGDYSLDGSFSLFGKSFNLNYKSKEIVALIPNNISQFMEWFWYFTLGVGLIFVNLKIFEKVKTMKILDGFSLSDTLKGLL